MGNFHSLNLKAFMGHVLDWRLIHRTEDDRSRLFRASVFCSPCSNVRFEEQGINLFTECIREAE
jgi:extracellular factor (EF) 3-hydroxypalmitic acid methyl ester biosynthesis protein